MELELDNKTYLIGKLDTFAQLHVARKLGPALPLVDGIVRPENAGKDFNILVLMILSQLSDEASEFVIRKCLSVVSVRQEKGWAKLMTQSGDLMFDDTSMDVMLKLTVATIEENLGSFFRDALGRLETVTSPPQP